MTRFYRWLMTMVNDPEFGEAAVYVRDHPELVVIRDSESRGLICGELFSHHVHISIRKKVRAAHKEWRRLQLVKKFGEWPLKTGDRDLDPNHEAYRIKGRITKLEHERKKIEEELLKLRRRQRELPQVG